MRLDEMETSRQAAQRLDVDASQIRRYCEEGRLKGAVKIANRWLIPKTATPPPKDFGRPPNHQKTFKK